MEQILKPEDFLKSGKQTQISKAIKGISTSVGHRSANLIFDILKVVHKNLKPDYSPEIKNKYLRARTADEILKSGVASGCTDYALLATALFRANGIPAVYVETFRRRWLEGNDDFIEGHVFVEVFINNKWLIVDPENACIKGWYDRFITYKKGLDSWDIGIKNFEDLKQAALKFREEYKKSK